MAAAAPKRRNAPARKRARAGATCPHCRKKVGFGLGSRFGSGDPVMAFHYGKDKAECIGSRKTLREARAARRNAPALTDRGYRYRAVKAVEGPKLCFACGSKRNLTVDHIDGRPEHSETDNLMWLCKSCNTAKGIVLKNARVGRLTKQFNASKATKAETKGAANLAQWLDAVSRVTPHRDHGQMLIPDFAREVSVQQAVNIIRATPKARRSEFAREIAARSGRLRAFKKEQWADRWNPCGGPARRRRNPAEGAARAFEEFNGRAPKELVEVSQRVHFHRYLAGMGLLNYLEVIGIDRAVHVIEGFNGSLLAFNEAKNQLFVVGGDQSINLADYGIDEPHELETLGRVRDIGYDGEKDHLGAEGGKALYIHRFRTTNENGEHIVVEVARYPDLIYRVRDKRLEFSGGSYKIRREGIDI